MFDMKTEMVKVNSFHFMYNAIQIYFVDEILDEIIL